MYLPVYVRIHDLLSTTLLCGLRLEQSFQGPLLGNVLSRQLHTLSESRRAQVGFDFAWTSLSRQANAE